MLSHWIQAARPKTLPLAVSGILLGSAVAYINHSFIPSTFYLGTLTAILLQILSNFANDYGDFIKGTDVQAGRKDRMLAAGKITASQMRLALILTAAAAFMSGIALLWFSLHANALWFLLFLVLGFAAIAAALAYTMGKRAFAYTGLGDPVVFIFFGWVAVGGIGYLHGDTLQLDTLLAGTGCGLLSVAVLNVNNLRDMDTDAAAGKKTIALRLGAKKALLYHRLLVWLGFTTVFLSFAYNLQQQHEGILPFEYLLILGVFSPVMIILAGHIHRTSAAVLQRHEESEIDSRLAMREAFNAELKKLSLSILLITLIYWLLTYLLG